MPVMCWVQDARLNYIEQHAARVGIDSERLESMRVSASRSSPLSDTLDLCARYSSPQSLPALVPRLTQLVARGVGLNTRVGVARFIGALVTRLAADIRPQSGPLIKVTQPLLCICSRPVAGLMEGCLPLHGRVSVSSRPDPNVCYRPAQHLRACIMHLLKVTSSL